MIGIPDERWSERPLACVVPADGEEIGLDELKAFLADRVPKWWIPNDIEIIDEVPKTSVGKFSKKTLRERFAARTPTTSQDVDQQLEDLADLLGLVDVLRHQRVVREAPDEIADLDLVDVEEDRRGGPSVPIARDDALASLSRPRNSTLVMLVRRP